MSSGWVPVELDLAGRLVVCVGAGRVAEGKLAQPLEAGAEVRVIAPQATPGLGEAADRRELTWHARPYAEGDLAEASLVIAGSDDPAVNERVAADAEALRVPCVRVDRDPAAEYPGSAAFPATLRRGPLVLTVGTGGAAPVLAGRLKRELAAQYPPEYGQLAELLAELRDAPEVQAALAPLGDDERRLRWRSVLDADTLQLIRDGELRAAREVAIRCLCSSSG
ncbi:bifunctional precorrin-2 dehydrogenase/sirohydrochlorin ferrochelatase [Egibacter rhizosphaerae]|uniref:precorrin-2 dehydrogenase n=1 Tax=Egibacter rhizosphaerae TaxID=1670831 RepID=A0A411YGM4_9ACTN|nr:bifunctional precorrin-2 dehydrogenase/sirohydrochlorin ferrochelatase [Egibacter rhizosphaerae]QBI20327.1 bifunctional precorrin-2 dehydrogenase/sirohydrochlorin ferrochelatase [Egibacter rhizosphaerae]